MSTEDRLRDALEAQASAVAPDPAAYPNVMARARRQRQRIWLATAGASAMAVLATIAVITTTRGDDVAVVPITSETPQPSATTEPEPTSTPGSTAQALSQDQFVALLQDRRVVVVSAETGQVSDTLATAVEFSGPYATVELTPDRKTVYVSGPTGDAWNPSCDEERPMMRIDLTPTRRVERLEPGVDPQVSPDGRFLAYRTKCGSPTNEQLLVIRDLQTGTLKRIRNTEEFGQADNNNEGPNIFTDHVWHHDGEHIWVTLDWESSPVLRLVDRTSAETLNDGKRITTQYAPYQLEAYGASALVFLHVCCYPELDGLSSIVRRSADGSEAKLVESPSSGNLRNPQVGPLGDLLWEQSGRLYRRGLNGATTDLGLSTAMARDW